MKFTFRKSQKMIGWLDFQSMDMTAQLPLHKGINHIGKGLEDLCEYNERNQLRGIVEQSQVLIRIEPKRCWITDATSTNQTTVIQGPSAHIVAHRLPQKYEEIKRATYFKETDLPYGIQSTDIVELPWEPFERNIDERSLVALHDGDVLWHFYGCMVFRLL